MAKERYKIVAVANESPQEMVSSIISDLSMQNCELEDVSSLRLGHTTVVVFLVDSFMEAEQIEEVIGARADEFGLHLIVEKTEPKKYQFIKSDAFIRVKGDHSAGINAYIISAFKRGGFEIHGMESETFSSDGLKHFVMNFKGKAHKGLDPLTEIASEFQRQNLDVTVSSDWSLLM